MLHRGHPLVDLSACLCFYWLPWKHRRRVVTLALLTVFLVIFLDILFCENRPHKQQESLMCYSSVLLYLPCRYSKRVIIWTTKVVVAGWRGGVACFYVNYSFHMFACYCRHTVHGSSCGWCWLRGCCCSEGRKMHRMFTPCSQRTHTHSHSHQNRSAVIKPPQVSDTLRRMACWASIKPAEKQEAAAVCVCLTSSASRWRVC